MDTVIAIVGRDKDNDIAPFFVDCAGDKNDQPTNVLSIPILDFIPPRFEHYLTLAEEMKTATSSTNPKGILICCHIGEGRTGTFLAASLIIDKFKKLSSEERKKLLNINRDYTPDTFGGKFSHLSSHFKTTSFVGEIVQNLRQLEQETIAKKVGISVETIEQFQTLEILQCMLSISEKLKDTHPISDEQILEIINEKNFFPEPLEEFFQIHNRQAGDDAILKAIKSLHKIISVE